jgi:hypothetical protein
MSTIQDAAQQMRLGAPAQQLLRSDLTPRAAVQALLDAGLVADALSLLARLLPRRYAVAWVCQCARQQPLSEHDGAGVVLAEAWVRQPDETHRAAALSFAAAHRYKTAGAWTAAAAGWSGGQLNPQAERPTPPPEHMTAIAAMAAVTHLSALVADQFAARRAAFVHSALDLLGPARASTEL